MRIIHTSDWHIGQHFMNKSRGPEHEAFLLWLLDLLIDKKVDALVVAGDIFDTGTPPSYARSIYFDFLKQSKLKWGGQIVIVGGNHDSVSTLNESGGLLEIANTIVIGGAEENPEDEVFILNHLADGKAGAIICAVPYLRDRDVRKSVAGEDAAAKSEALRCGISEHYKTVYDKARAMASEYDYDLPLIATGHLTTRGGELTEGVRELYIGTLQGYASDDFPEDFDYIALGHLHKKQIMGKRKHIRYCGSPIPLSFMEAKYKRTVNLVDLESKKVPVVEELIVPCTQSLKTLKGKFDEITEKIKDLSLEPKQTLWLEIEIELDETQGNITKDLNDLIEDLPIEILRIKRMRRAQGASLKRAKTERLHEMSVEDVFQKRLKEADLDEAKEKDLTLAFKQIYAQIQEDS